MSNGINRRRFLNVPDGSTLIVTTASRDDHWLGTAEVFVDGAKTGNWDDAALKQGGLLLLTAGHRYKIIIEVVFTGTQQDASVTLFAATVDKNGAQSGDVKSMTFSGRQPTRESLVLDAFMA